jgi:large subunit ribosomal protein L23
MDPFTVILYPLVTEESVRLLEAENKIIFIVDPKTTKKEIVRAVNELYEVDVEKVNTLITPQGKKKAFVKLTPDFQAADLAAKLGIL